MTAQVLSVTQLNEYIRETMDRNPMLSSVAVEGEISNYKVYPSGHHYFTLKDNDGSLKCVMFRNSAIKLRFQPEHGMKVVAIGKVTVYPRDGTYQLYCNTMIPTGAGDLQAAFEQLKKKLAAKGYFDPAHKKPIPKYPNVIGIITSSAGAALHDMLRILRKRYPLTSVKLLPVRVQGAEAPGEISAAIRYANTHNLADVLIVGRGGGSLEDLWAFNEEIVAKAIFESEIPVISAVGHEPDVTISDYVADLRAATPSNAAELAVPDQDALHQMLDGMSSAISAACMRYLKNARRQLDLLAQSQSMQSCDSYVKHRYMELDALCTRLNSGMDARLNAVKNRYIALTASLDAMSPLKVMTRGYSIAINENNKIIRSVKDAAVGDGISLQVSDGIIHTTVVNTQEKI